MNTFKKILLSALLVCGGVCAMNAQEKTTTAGVPLVTLNNGVEMPRFGLGTFLQGSNEICRQSCLTALKAGYRHIDTAHAYNDEEGVGQAVKESGIPREEIWITSKLWPNEYGEGKTLKAIDDMLKRLQLDYIDLLYVHQPFGDFVGAWKDMEKAVKMGKVRALGISNFDANDEVWNTIMDSATIKPAVLQIECHPYAQRLEMRKKAAKEGIQVECWFPLGGAMSNGALFKDPVIRKIAEAHGKSPAQIILRWHIQEGFSVIPGATNPDYIKENIQIFDFALTDEEMQQMRSLNKEQRFFTMQIIRFFKMWTLPLGMFAGVGVYLMFHYIPWLSPHWWRAPGNSVSGSWWADAWVIISVAVRDSAKRIRYLPSGYLTPTSRPSFPWRQAVTSSGRTW